MTHPSSSCFPSTTLLHLHQRRASTHALRLIALSMALQGSAPVWAQTSLPQSVLEYNAEGQLTKNQDPLGHATTHSYDAAGRLTQQTPPAPSVAASGVPDTTQYRYDGQGQLQQLTDGRGNPTRYTTDGLGNTTAIQSPDTGTTQSQYDVAGNLTQRTDARGKVVKYSYDNAGRLSKVQYFANASATTAEETHTYTWLASGGGAGQLGCLNDASGWSCASYDAFGRLTYYTRQINGTTPVALVSAYSYTAKGQLASVTYPSGHQLTYSYNTVGELTGLSLDGKTLLSNLTTTPFGPAKGWAWGNAQLFTRQFDANGRQTGYSLGDAQRQLGWDTASRLTDQSDQSGTTRTPVATAGYDNRDRLTGYTLTSPASTYGYTYDANGNRTQLVSGANAYTLTPEAASNRLTATTGPAPARSYTYDLAGNPLTDGVRSYVWSARGTLKSVTTGSGASTQTTTYTYNGLAQRVKKTNSSATTLYAYDPAGHLLGEYKADGSLIAEHIWLGDTPVALIQADAQERTLDDTPTSTANFTVSGTWTSGTTTAGYWGADYLSHATAASSPDQVTWKLTGLAAAGSYRLYARWTQGSNRATNATYRITHAGGTTTVTQNQQYNGGKWNLLGTFSFDPVQASHQVALLGQGNGAVIADAIKLEAADASARTFSVQADQTDTPRALLDATGKVVWRWEGEAFGMSAPNEDPDGDGKTLSYNPRFPGQVYDQESGLHYNHHRYYDPQTGRYLSSDPIGLAGGTNTYSYVKGNPVTDKDPLGLMGSRGDPGLHGGKSYSCPCGQTLQTDWSCVAGILSQTMGGDKGAVLGGLGATGLGTWGTLGKSVWATRAGILSQLIGVYGAGATFSAILQCQRCQSNQ